MDDTHSHAGESGFALVEAVISAVVLAVVALAVLSGIDASIHSAGRERSRSVASTLAEQDQERMRAMSTADLADMVTLTRTLTVSGVTYTVSSSSQWIRDDTGGTVSCINNAKQVDYLEISSTVTSNTVGREIKPVTMSSLVAPPVGNAKGTLAVQVNDRNSVGIVGLDVVATAKTGGTFTETTNSLGCAIFTRIPVDSYTITLNRAGWVDTFGRNPGTAGAGVLNNATQVVTMKFDRAATIAWSVTSLDPWSTTPTAAIASQPPIIVTNTSTGATQAGTVSADNGEEPTAQRTWTVNPATSVFPFLTKYPMWTGSCSQSSPATWDPNYYVTNPGSIATNPGQAHTLSPAMQQPVLKLALRDSTGAYLPTARTSDIYATVQPDPTDPTPCTETYRLRNYAGAAPYAGGGIVGQWRSSVAADPYVPAGLPFGKYDVCVKEINSGTSRWAILNNVDLTVMGTRDAGILQINQFTTRPTSVPCPA
jgi:Tfp pilus assembly protein PilV